MGSFAAICAIAAIGSTIGCGASGQPETERSAPAPSEFPPAGGRTLGALADLGEESNLVVSPAGMVADPGLNRLAFGVFELTGEQVDDADIALYFAEGREARARGPFPARVDSLRTPLAYRGQTTASDPSAATSVYVVEGVPVKRPGELAVLALIRGDGELRATRLPSLVVGKFPAVPDIGELAPRIHTPTAEEVGGDLSQIDTRLPPDSMHQVDYADALGRKPILLILATPQFCESRVCGPVVDIAEQVKGEFTGDAAFIHMEIYTENDPSKGVRPQVRAFGLPSEPWAFVIDDKGIVRDRLEGAFGATELGNALRAAAG